MPERKTPRPTDAELEILKVLWRRGPSTVREVFESFGDTKTTGYTTVLKLMQIMADKGLVVRDESERAHRYEAAHAEEDMQRRLDGSAKKLVLQALSAKRASAKELSEIRRVLDELERGKR